MKLCKKVICLLMAAAIVFSMAACGQKEVDEDSRDEELINEEEKVEESKDEYVRVIDLQDASFHLPKEVIDSMYWYNNADELIDENYYKYCWSSYINIFKGDYSEILGIEIIEHEEYYREIKNAKDVLENIVGISEMPTIKKKETIIENDNNIIISIETLDGFSIDAGDETVDIVGNGYVFCIRGEKMDFIGLFLSDNEVPDWFLKTIESVGPVNYSEYKLSKSELDRNLDEMTNIRVMQNITLDIPSIAYDNRVNAFGLFTAIDDELLEYNKEDIYVIIDEDSDYFTMGTTDMTFSVLAKECFRGNYEFNLEMVEHELNSFLDVMDFEGKEVKSDSSSKIFKVSFRAEDEGLDGEDVEIQYFGHVGLYEVDGDGIAIIALYDEENDWTFDTIKSVKIEK